MCPDSVLKLSNMFNIGAGEEIKEGEGRSLDDGCLLDARKVMGEAIGLYSGNENVKELEADQLLTQGLKLRKEHKMDPKSKGVHGPALNPRKTFIHNCFTRARVETGEVIKFLGDQDTQTTPSTSELGQVTLLIRTAPVPGIGPGTVSCTTGSSLDASTIGELIELADSALEESKSSHHNRPCLGTNPTGMDSGPEVIGISSLMAVPWTLIGSHVSFQSKQKLLLEAEIHQTAQSQLDEFYKQEAPGNSQSCSTP
ncbi:hypothetical protein NDU88_005559 [Pleurodeles waltl]|uniref:Uncharacterized protein n=1 Tax=Pleurodeles waltl TaxID=8319 RepID=A0AAV7MX48_PLEWA|nr:hypothetical protein NDU88_005559 [Pleurodeles waltl]